MTKVYKSWSQEGCINQVLLQQVLVYGSVVWCSS